MTLRTRLVVALGLLLLAGLVTFGVVTLSLYKRSQLDQLDEDLRNSQVPALATVSAGTAYDDRYGEPIDGGGSSADKAYPVKTYADTTIGGKEPKPTGADRYGDHKPGPRPDVISVPGTYLELRDAGGVVNTDQVAGDDRRPQLPGTLPAEGTAFLTAGTVDGDGEWRVMVSAMQTARGRASLVVAVPTDYLAGDRNELLMIELAAGAALLALLAGGSWLILLRGLRPLERMAAAAHRISDGDLSERVAPADGRSEVGQLGEALNNMLDQIELSFRRQEATEAKLRQFLSDASHELRTPLTSIQGFAELFRLGVDKDHVNLPIIMRRIEEESLRMRGLVEDLLLLARLDERREPVVAAVDLAVLAADACSDAVAADPDRPVVLHAADPVVVDGDRDHLRQAIANLVNNALRHTAAGTTIEVRASHEPPAQAGGRRRAVVSVRDHGRGLDPDALAHVFDRFWQADAARVGRGAGLGLSIVAAIAAEHGGDVHAANHPDGGAVFTLTLPAADGHHTLRPVPAEPTSAGEPPVAAGHDR
ncbi:MAG: HAMP domain-containing sensor histidine kinase [Acidimicrobiales bacterium]